MIGKLYALATLILNMHKTKSLDDFICILRNAYVINRILKLYANICPVESGSLWRFSSLTLFQVGQLSVTGNLACTGEKPRKRIG